MSNSGTARTSIPQELQPQQAAIPMNSTPCLGRRTFVGYCFPNPVFLKPCPRRGHQTPSLHTAATPRAPPSSAHTAWTITQTHTLPCCLSPGHPQPWDSQVGMLWDCISGSITTLECSILPSHSASPQQRPLLSSPPTPGSLHPRSPQLFISSECASLHRRV